MWKTTVMFGLVASGIAIFLWPENKLEVPTLPNTEWGPQIVKSTEIKHFKIDVPASTLDDLKYRLEHRRTYVKPLENAAWTYGISSKQLDTILDYWKNKYNWSERQALLNKYPQFTTNVQGLKIHFYHVKPNPADLPKGREIKILPLLLLHGWPGSVVEFQKLIPMLTKPSPNQNFVFEVIIPSLPGYGFSEGAIRPGMGCAQMATLFKNFMVDRLGFSKFYAQGGDWGSIIVANMAALFPEKILGVHLNMCGDSSPSNLFWLLIGSYFPSLVGVNENYSLYFPLSTVLSKLIEESGYFHLQATKPDTIGAALTSSPDALAAYILEKFSTWTNASYRQQDDGGLLEKFTLDELLDNVMIYWITNSITTSVRLYAENFSSAHRALKVEKIPINVPTACAVFPNEILNLPKRLLKDRYPNLIQHNIMPRGGHFAAFEEPKLVADDIFSFVKQAEQLHSKSS